MNPFVHHSMGRANRVFESELSGIHRVSSVRVYEISLLVLSRGNATSCSLAISNSKLAMNRKCLSHGYIYTPLTQYNNR